MPGSVMSEFGLQTPFTLLGVSRLKCVKAPSKICSRQHSKIWLYPQLRRYRHDGILVSGLASFRQELCISGFWNFIYRFLMEKYWTHFFFSCLSYLPFGSYVRLNKIWMKSNACHILWTVHVRILKFHIWISHGKIADLYFLSCPSYFPLWSYTPLKKSEWNIFSKLSQKVFELGAWNLVTW